jgi:hypothetical protein
MQISQNSGVISNVRSTLREGLSNAARGTAARALAASETNGGDPLFTGTPPIGTGSDSFDRTVTTTTDDITITVNVARVQNGGVAANATDSTDPTQTGETIHLEIKTTDDSLSGKSQKIIVDPTEAASANISDAQLASIESNLADGTGVYAGTVSIDDQRTITQKVDQTSLVPDASGTLQSVESSSTQTFTGEFDAHEKSQQAFDATTGDSDDSRKVASALVKTFSSTGWLGANIPGLHISASA